MKWTIVKSQSATSKRIESRDSDTVDGKGLPNKSNCSERKDQELPQKHQFEAIDHLPYTHTNCNIPVAILVHKE